MCLCKEDMVQYRHLMVLLLYKLREMRTQLNVNEQEKRKPKKKKIFHPRRAAAWGGNGDTSPQPAPHLPFILSGSLASGPRLSSVPPVIAAGTCPGRFWWWASPRANHPDGAAHPRVARLAPPV